MKKLSAILVALVLIAGLGVSQFASAQGKDATSAPATTMQKKAAPKTTKAPAKKPAMRMKKPAAKKSAMKKKPAMGMKKPAAKPSPSPMK